jgi:hypothetical protein
VYRKYWWPTGILLPWFRSFSLVPWAPGSPITSRLGATRASATTFLIPGVALALGIIVRGEHVALVSVLGSALCLLGAWTIHRAKTRNG